MSNKTQTLSAAQTKTLDYIREHGRVRIDCLSTGGYSIKSAEALIRKGLLVKVVEDSDDWRGTWRFAALAETD